MPLRVWTNGTDTVIAEDLDDVKRVLASQYGSNEFDEDDGWYVCPDNESLTVHWEDQPEGVDPKITKTCAEWIASEGRGFLCSTEY